jgi:hypothetical protein
MRTGTIKQLLGIKKSVPLTLAEMGAALRLCSFPETVWREAALPEMAQWLLQRRGFVQVSQP